MLKIGPTKKEKLVGPSAKDFKKTRGAILALKKSHKLHRKLLHQNKSRLPLCLKTCHVRALITFTFLKHPIAYLVWTTNSLPKSQITQKGVF